MLYTPMHAHQHFFHLSSKPFPFLARTQSKNMIKTVAVTLAAIAAVANGESNLRSNTAAALVAATAPSGTKFYAIMGKISGRKNKLAPGIGVHCLARGTTKATEAPYDGKVWGDKHSAMSVQCCGADTLRVNNDNNKKWVVKKQGKVFATRFTRNDPANGGKWNQDACETGKTLDEAFAICANKGLRMCTKDEVMANEQNIGCNTGSNLQWTSTPCDGAVGGTPNKDVSTELAEIRNEFKDLIAAEVPPTAEEEAKDDDKFECTTDKNFIQGSYSQIEVNLNGQKSRKIFDEYEAVAYCRNECDKREASGAGCKAFWYQRHRPSPTEHRGTHGYKLCAFYKANGNAVRHGHGGKSQVCVRKAGSAGAVASTAAAPAVAPAAVAPPVAAPVAVAPPAPKGCEQTDKSYSQGARCIQKNGKGSWRKNKKSCCSSWAKKRGYQWKVIPPCKQTSNTSKQGAKCHGDGAGGRTTADWCCSKYGQKQGYQWK